MMVSVIIPVFNGAKHIDSCVESLFGQTYDEWEAIFVNDGSTDNSLDLLQQYARTDSRIVVLNQPNQGVAKAREVGIKQAKGDYVTFLDVDDFLSGNALRLMVETFGDRVDIVVSGLNIVRDGRVIREKKLLEQELSHIDYLKKVLCGRVGWELCAKMYRSRLFQAPMQTPTGIKIGEDAAVFMQLVCRADKVRMMPQQVYNYVQYVQSASHVKSKQYAEETLKAAFFIDGIFQKEAFYSEIRTEIGTMFLLFYSNSSRKFYLGRKHPLVREIRKKYFSWVALLELPGLKRVYVILSYFFGRLLLKCV